MRRRSYLASLSSLPALSSFSSVARAGQDDVQTNIRASWFYETVEGDIVVLEDRDPILKWEYDSEGQEYWKQITRAVTETREPDLPVVYDVEGCELRRVHTCSPFWLSLFVWGQDREVLVDVFDAKHTDEVAYRSRIYTWEEHIQTLSGNDLEELVDRVERYIEEDL